MKGKDDRKGKNKQQSLFKKEKLNFINQVNTIFTNSSERLEIAF